MSYLRANGKGVKNISNWLPSFKLSSKLSSGPATLGLHSHMATAKGLQSRGAVPLEGGGGYALQVPAIPHCLCP